MPENFRNERDRYKKRIENNRDRKQMKNILNIMKQTDVQKCIAFCIDLMYNKQYPYVEV